ncbi:RCC1 domain-containing protein 1 [Elgaria multicarinata webbii]|uniref:RCC1 domain-containing protein 1 n=1 Tax=Elgaria multicarinata webbii TaxID=159646 RepID=UPI002FCCFB87
MTSRQPHLHMEIRVGIKKVKEALPRPGLLESLGRRGFTARAAALGGPPSASAAPQAPGGGHGGPAWPGGRAACLPLSPPTAERAGQEAGRAAFLPAGPASRAMAGSAGEGRAAPCGWFQFGFCFGAATEAGLAPVALGEAGRIRRVRPSWSFAAILATGAAPGRLLQGAASAALPPDCLDALPSETHVLLLREAALEGWPLPAEGDWAGVLDGQPAWRRALLPEEAAAADLPLVPGGYVAPRPPFFTPLPAALQARKLALGHEHAVLLSSAGTVFSWGGGRHGQLGHGELESRAEPLLVDALHGVEVADVAAGGWHSAGISEAGDLYIWGWNESGQLALPSKAVAESQATTAVGAGRGDVALNVARSQGAANSPHKAAFISIQPFPALLDMPCEAAVSKVSCGSRHTAAVTSTGDLYTWGWGKYGQLGHRDTASSDQPRRVCYFVDWKLCVVDVVCGPWTTYTHAVGR